MRWRGLFVAVLAAGTLGACAPSTRMHTVAAEPFRGDVKAVLVVQAMNYPGAGSGADRALARRLEACGVASKQVAVESVYDAFNPPNRDRIRAEALRQADGFAFDSVLEIVENGKYVDQVRGSRRLTYHTIELRTPGTDRPAWMATMSLAGNSGGMTEVVEVFARDLMGQLVKDGVIRTCPAAAG